ncbi:MAG: nitroreductase family deazaflavin-dependent oxidoreductase [Ardenticatenaceae bacterium]|nr:nitroreductase family deazaflavin-dependent oxidoreductase [Ardenticatenaceae bacterium]
MFHYLTVHFHEHAADVRQGLEAYKQGSPIRQKAAAPPTGLGKLAFRAPIYLFRAGLGSLLGQRFLLLNHIGRKSGQPRQAVLEVVHYEPDTDTYFVASGYGRQSQWFRNIKANPEVTIQVGRRKLAVTADILGPEASGEMMVQYAQRYPNAAKNLSRLIGYQVDGSAADYQQIAAEHIPFVAMRPRLVLEESRPLWPLAVAAAALAGLGLLLRKKRHEN